MWPRHKCWLGLSVGLAGYIFRERERERGAQASAKFKCLLGYAGKTGVVRYISGGYLGYRANICYRMFIFVSVWYEFCLLFKLFFSG